MTLTEEQANEIKKNLLKQLGKFPEDKREEIKEKVDSMSPDQVETLIKQNQLTQNNGCIFCSIFKGENPAIKIAETADNIAILEINPISKGHTLIIPKEHGDLNENSESFAKKVAQRIKEKFNPLEIKINQSNPMGHNMIEVTPIYGDEKERTPAKIEDLKKIQEEFLNENTHQENEKIIPDEINENKKEETIKLPPRIP
jgi:diadenosine tetraphosphate (Ap4A) HIT family hydrolase